MLEGRRGLHNPLFCMDHIHHKPTVWHGRPLCKPSNHNSSPSWIYIFSPSSLMNATFHRLASLSSQRSAISQHSANVTGWLMRTLTPLRKCPRAVVCQTLTAHLSRRPQIHITLPLQTITATTAAVHSVAGRPTARSRVQSRTFPRRSFALRSFLLLLTCCFRIRHILKDVRNVLHISQRVHKNGTKCVCAHNNSCSREHTCGHIALLRTCRLLVYSELPSTLTQ